MPEWIFLQEESVSVGGPEGVPDAVMEILARRGIEPEAACDFFAEKPRTSYDPFLLADLREAVDLILEYCRDGRRICVYGDYDADGVTSVALLTSVLRHFTENVDYYMPSRFSDGYGLNIAAIDSLHEEEVELIVTVDCGSTSLAEIAYAKEKGIEIIVTDHHSPGPEEPDCLFINPKRRGSAYPFDDLSGCGVAFKLVQGITRTCELAGDERFSRYEQNELLDLVAISTVADVVSLLDENRTLVKYGLMYINDRRRPGLNILLEELGMAERFISSEEIAFIIAPHINALGRISSAELGVELLMSERREEELREMARKMIENNTRRKTLQDDVLELCLEALEEGDSGEFFPVIYVPDAHEGVTGIVAGNLKETLYKPVCIVSIGEDGLLKGTGRSIPGVNIHELFSTCPELFMRFGGHSGACGFSMPEENLESFRERMQDEMRTLLDNEPGLLDEKLYIEKVLHADEKNLDFADFLSKLEPYGAGNERPLFAVMDAGVISVYLMGAEEQHMRFTIMTGDGIPIECVLFRRAGDFRDIVVKDAFVNVAGELSVNEYSGRRLQMIVRDLKGA